MKYVKILLSSVFLALVFAGNAAVISTPAQTPHPTVQASPTPMIPGQNTDGATLSAYLQQIVQNFIHFKTTFINTIEGRLGGYFAVLAYILAWIIAIYYFVQQFLRGEWDASEIGRYTGSIVVCLLLLIFCGDVDQDGRRGDIVRMPAYVGYYLSFGEDPAEPTGSYLNRQVNEQRDRFNTDYQNFIENKLMVKINDQDMPVRYPGMQGIQKVAAVAVGNPPKPGSAEEKEMLSQSFWIGLGFQVMNFFRSIIEIIDFFLLVLYSFGILVCSIIAPFMFAPFVNRELRKRFTYPFLWTIFTVTIIFPAMSQGFRFAAYLAANMALGTSGNPIYTFDATTYTIVANGDPTPMILVACLMMLISIVLLVMSLILSYSFAQGKLLESMSGLIANTFAGISSIGLGALVSSYATRLTTDAEKTSIAGQYDSASLLAQHNLQGQQASLAASRNANRVSTLGNEQSAMVGAVGDANAKNTSDVGQLLLGQRNAQIQQYQTQASAYASTANQIASLNQGEREELMKKGLSTYMEVNRITDEADKEKILNAVGAVNLRGDKLDNYWESMGIIGSVGKQFFNGKTYEAVKGRSIINAAEGQSDAYQPEMPFELSNGTQFSIQDFLEQGVAPQLALQQPNMPKMSGGGGAMPNSFAQPNFQSPPPAMTTADSPTDNAGFLAVPSTNGDPNWEAATMRQYASAYGFNQAQASADGKQLNLDTSGKTPEEIENFQNIAKSVGIQTQSKDGGMVMSDMPPVRQIPKALQTTTGKLPRYGQPNIPSTLFNPLSSGMSASAAKKPIANAGAIYYDPSQEAMFQSTGNKYYDGLLLGAARTHGINPNVLRAQFYQESRFKKNATSNKGAGGIAQIMPTTAPRLGVTDRYDEAQSVYGGAKYMRYIADFMVAKGGVNEGNRIRSLSLAGYNSGEGRVQKSGFNVPGIAETQDYVSRINGNVARFNQVNPQKSPNMFINDLNRFTRPEAEVYSKKFANFYGQQTGVRRAYLDNQVSNQITRESYGEKKQIAAANMQMQYSIGDNVATMTGQSLADKYQTDYAATQTTLSARMQQAEITRNTGLQAGEINYLGGMTQASLQYQGQMQSAEITRQAALDAMYKRNLANLVQTVGNSTSHQLSEMFERASRGL